MALITGTPAGNVVNQEEIYIDGAPNIYFQDYTADPLFNPDGDGYYYNLSGTTSYPANGLACITEVSFGQGLTANDIRCDTVGVKGQIQRRDYVEFTFSLQTFLPLSVYTRIVGFSAATVGSTLEKVGMGVFDNTQFWMIYAPKVYDPSTGDYLLIHLHKAQFVEPGNWEMRYGEPWIQQFTVRGFADDTKPNSMLFGTILRADPSAIA